MPTMVLQSLGLRTDVMIAGWHAEIQAHPHHIVVRTPSNPSYHSGNFLIFDAPPDAASFERWQATFAAEIAERQETHHVLLAWDDPRAELGDVSAFLEAGFVLEYGTTLTAQALHAPARPHPHAEVRALRSDDDWAQATENQILCREERFTEESYRVFKVAQMRNYRMLSAQGHGAWYGAFVDGKLVADLGIYHQGDIARYQNVGTHPDFRRQGLCGTLVHQAGRDVLDRTEVTHLVMVAETESSPSRIYQSVGFSPTERTCALYLGDPDGRS